MSKPKAEPLRSRDKLKVAKPAGPDALPDKLTYALAAYCVEMRSQGWYIAKAVPSFAGKPEWQGPFGAIENAVLAIGRRLATEIADRHTRMIERHKIKPGDPLYGLKKTTRLRQKKPSAR